jgi:hypothetical protein
MQSAEKQMVFCGHTPAYRIDVRLLQAMLDRHLVSRCKAVRGDCHARCRRNLDSMKDAVCLAQRHIADTLRSARGFPGSLDRPNRANLDGTPMVSPRSRLCYWFRR